MKYKVTVGIPVYNDSQFIDKCLQSVINQTIGLNNIEIICIDDGSTDETAEIIKYYINKYSSNNNIFYDRHENSGSPSLSRNKIIELSNGEYIFFLDGDDFLGPEAIERMYNQGKDNDADIIIGKYKGINRGVPVLMFNEKKERTTFFDSKVIDSLNALKMFRTDFIRKYNIKFNTSILHAEDHPFTMKAYLHTRSISIVNDYDCYYWTRYSDGNRTQLTQQLINVRKFYDYFFETLDVIQDADLPKDLINLAAYKYWRRLLLLDLPNEFRRPRSIEEKRISFNIAKSIAKKYMTEEIYNHFQEKFGKEKLILDIILDGSYRLVEDYILLNYK